MGFALEDCIDKVRRVLKKPKQITTEVSNREVWPKMTSLIRHRTGKLIFKCLTVETLSFML